MKTISVSLYNRPQYTKILLESLNECFGIDEYTIHIRCEPGNEEVINMARQFRPDQTWLQINNNRLGCNTNILTCVHRAIKVSGYNIHFEDDTIPGKDCLRYFEWAGEKYKDNKEVFTISGYVNSNNNTEHFSKKSNDIYGVRRRQWFTPWGWATWADRFAQMRAHWDCSGRNGSWDVTINNIRKDRYEIFPEISRIQNIGAEMGTHVPDAQWHKKHHFNEYWIESVGSYANSIDNTCEGQFIENE